MMRIKDFISSIDDKTPEKILLKKSVEELNAQRFSFNVEATLILDGASVESVYATADCLMLLFSKDGKVYGLDWTDGAGVILCEYLPPEPLS